jgi:hypothetical protein
MKVIINFAVMNNTLYMTTHREKQEMTFFQASWNRLKKNVNSKSNLQHTHTGLSFLLLLLSFLYFGSVYTFHLHEQEQLQLFLFTPDYFWQTLSHPGGLSDYISRFVTQFFCRPLFGAFLIALLLVALQRHLLVLTRCYKEGVAFEPLTFIPPIFFWCLMGNDNYLLGGLISALFVLPFAWLYAQIHGRKSRFIYAAIATPLLYWMVGAPFVLFPIFALTLEYFCYRTKIGSMIVPIIVSVLLVILPPLLTKQFLLQDTLHRLWWGGDFWRYPYSYPVQLPVFWALCLIPILFRWFPTIAARSRKGWLFFSALAIVVLLCGAFFVRRSIDIPKEEVMAYDYYTRTRQWKEVIKLADYRMPRSPLSIACLNLALCKEDRMGEMFHYHQSGPEGLFPTFVRDFTVPFISGEIYFQLGFINTAQRYAFEAMEALPDYQMSVRSIVRLAETNIINGEDVVALKYLHILQHTLFYRKWATRVIAKMKEGTALDDNVEWKNLSHRRSQNDFIFQPNEMDKMMGLMLMQQWGDQELFNYLLAYSLLKRDLPHFLECYRLGDYHGVRFNPIPQCYQEALYYIWMNTKHDPTEDIPYSINANVISDYDTFRSILSSYRHPQPMLQTQFSTSYWYYLYFRK